MSAVSNTRFPPYATRPRSVRAVMGWVLVALLPMMCVQAHFFGVGLWWQYAFGAFSALGAEVIALRLRAQPWQGVLDNSALVTAALLAVSMPPLAPWWLISSGAAFAMLLGKAVYGGLGFNPFNPAMLAYAALLVSFPKYMTAWPSADGNDLALLPSLQVIINHAPMSVITSAPDVLSGASPLAAIKSGLSLRQTMDEIFRSPVFGQWAGRGWEWVSLSALLGGMWLLLLGIIRWHIPVAMLLGMMLAAWLGHQLDPGRHAEVGFHLLAGSTMVGAFFIATDPVTAATSERGRLIYGAGIGVLTYFIRDVGHYHDGLAFAVLLMNGCVPLIDRFTVPRIYGESR